MIRNAFFAVFVMLLVTHPSNARELEIELVHDGETRRAEVILPDRRLSGDPAPAILALHGGGGTPRRVRRYTGFSLSERGWVEIYPEGLDNQWNDGRVGADDRPLRDADDVGFLKALVNRLASDGLVDPARVYLTGASNGGMMTMRMACDAPDLVAGASVVIASWPVGLVCASDKPIPVMLLHGTDDELIRYDGGRVVARRGKDRGAVLSGGETLRIWAMRNRCAESRKSTLPDLDPNDKTRVYQRVYIDCTAPLTHFIVEGGGHTWPGRPDRWLVRAFLGRSSQDINLTAEIERFFLGLDAPR